MRTLKPMLARIGSRTDLKNKESIFEPKFDGYRALCYVTPHDLKFISRNGIDITASYPEFAVRSNIKAHTAILDGEIIMCGAQGNPDFNLLQLHNKGVLDHSHATYVVFDILMKNNEYLMHKSLLERKKILTKTLKEKPLLLELSPATTNGPLLWRLTKKMGMEGVMAKKKDGLYYPGARVNEWLKIKERQTLDCIILGYTQQKKLVSSLVLGVYYRGKLICIGKVGSGFGQETVRMLYKKLKPIQQSMPACPCDLHNVQWVKPKLICEVFFQEQTKDKKLRIPVFVRLRTDKKLRECTWVQ